MKQLFKLIINSIIAFIALSFSCSDIKTKLLCQSIDSCEYSDSSCKGTIKPFCHHDENCYYIWSNASIEDADGSIEKPYTTISKAASNAKESNVSLILINDIPSREYIASSISVSSARQITVKSLFDKYNSPIIISNSSYIFSSTKYQSISVENIIFNKNYTGCGFIKSTSSLIDIYIKNSFYVNGKGTCYSISIFSAKSLIVRNLTIENSEILTRIQTRDENTFDIDGFYVKNCTTVSKMFQFINTYGKSSIKNAYIDGISSGGSTRLFPTVFSLDSNVECENITIKNLNITAFYSTYLNYVSFNNITLQNAKMDFNQSLISIQAKDSFIQTNFSKLTMKNIQTDLPVINIKLGKYVFDELVIDNISLYNQDFQGLEQLRDPVLTATDSKQVNITNFTITNIQTNAVNLINSLLFLTKGVFMNTNEEKETETGISWVVIQENQQVQTRKYYIADVIFESTQMKSQKGSSIIYDSQISDITSSNGIVIKDCIFKNQISKKGGSISIMNQLGSSLKMYNSLFYENYASEAGGALFHSQFYPELKTDNRFLLSIEQCVFSKCFSSFKGGAIATTPSKFVLNQSIIASSISRYGGAGFISNSKIVEENESAYFNNIALSIDPTLGIFGDDSLITSKNSESNNNWAPISGNSTQTHPYKFKLIICKVINSYILENLQDLEILENSDLIQCFYNETLNSGKSLYVKDHIATVYSGIPMPMIVQVICYNKYNEVLEYISDDQFQVNIENSTNRISIIQGRTLQFRNGRLNLYPNVLLQAKNSTKAQLTLSPIDSKVNFLSFIGMTFTIKLNIQFIECPQGSKYDSHADVCILCREGTYSFSDPYSSKTSCHSCSQHMQCLGGYSILPQRGYQKVSENSTDVLKCPIDGACLGGLLDDGSINQTGFCEYPFSGKLCSSCIEGYTLLDKSGQCTSCLGSLLYYFQFVGLNLVQFAIVVFGVYSKQSTQEKISQAYETDDLTEQQNIQNDILGTVIIKIIMNFNQVLGILQSYNFDFPPILQQFQIINSNVIPSMTDKFSIDCFIKKLQQDKEMIFFINYFILLAKPFVVWLLMTLVYFIIYKCKKESTRILKKKLVKCFIVVGFLFQPAIILQSLSMFHCISLDDGSNDSNTQKFLKANLQIQCWGDFHGFVAKFIALPSLLLWIIFLPILLYNKIQKSLKKVNFNQTLANYSFIIGAFKRECIFWEFVVSIRKIALIAILVFLDFLSPFRQALLSCIILAGCIYFHQQMNPYNLSILNKIETMQLAAVTSMALVCVYFIKMTDTEHNYWVGYLLTIFSVGLSISFIIQAIILYKQVSQSKIEKQISRVSTIFAKLRSKLFKEKKVEDDKEGKDIELQEGKN